MIVRNRFQAPLAAPKEVVRCGLERDGVLSAERVKFGIIQDHARRVGHDTRRAQVVRKIMLLSPVDLRRAALFPLGLTWRGGSVFPRDP